MVRAAVHAEAPPTPTIISMPDYRYELRLADEVVATGHLTRDESLEVGEQVVIGGRAGIVRSVEPRFGERELDLVVQLRAGHPLEP